MPSRLLVPPRQALWKPQGPLALDAGHPLVVGLRHAYPMNEGGGLAFNLVRPSESISLGAGVTWSRNSQYGVVLNFNNSTTGRAVLSSTFTPAATVFSVEMAVRVAVAPASNNFEYLFGSASTNGNGILLTNATTTPKGWDIDTATADLAVGSLPTNNIWYHLVFVYVSTSSATIYQNGLSVASGGLAGTIAFPLGWMGADGTNAGNNFGGDIGWLRVWDRALNQADATSLYADPFEMFVSGREKATQFAIVGSSPAPAYSPLASVLTAASPPLVAPWPPRSAFMSPPSGGSTVNGTATIIGNSLLAESALVVSPSDPTISNSLLAEAVQIISPSGDAEIASSALVESSALVLAPATEISNSAVVESAAAILAPATEIANSLLADAAQVVSNGDMLISNATLAEAAQLVETTSDSAIEQGNAAIVESVGQVVDPALAIVANSLLVVTGNIAGQGGGTLIANAALAESAAQLLVPATQQSSAVLAQTAARILVVATLQANALLAITGSVIGQTNYPQPIGALASVNIPTASASGTQPGASVASNTPTGTKG